MHGWVDTDTYISDQTPPFVCSEISHSKSITLRCCTDLDKAGNRDSLKFPLFHQEMLTQSWWNAGENVGRVKVVISEGIARGRGISPFERLRNIVSFSFQHAPISEAALASVPNYGSLSLTGILETSGIAWPNPGMWYQPAQPSYNTSSSRKFEEADIDAHAHSPRRRSESFSSDRDKSGPAMPPPPVFPRPMAPPALPALPAQGSDLRNTRWPLLSTMHDPFVETGLSLYRPWRSRSEDQSMPDYSDTTRSASSRDITNTITNNNSLFNKPGNELPHEQDSFDDLLNTSSPDKDDLSGYYAPANSRASSATNTPSMRTKPLEASYPQEHTRAVSITIKEPPLAANRQTSDFSMFSRFSEVNAAFNACLDSRILGKPAGEIKSKKEGKGNELNIAQKGVRKVSARSASQREAKEEKASKKTGENVAVVSDSKRKRCVKIARPEDDVPCSSPSRKVSKTGKYDISVAAVVDDANGEGGLSRVPLCSLENVVREA